MSKKLTSSCNDALQTNQNEIILYRPNDTISLEVRLENDTVWLTTSQMAELFNREESNIRRHIINIFNEDELEKNINVHFLHVNGVKKSLPPAEKVFFDGQLFDAHILMSRLIESAEKRIVLIDNYIDLSVLELLSKRKANVSAKVYTLQISRTFRQDIQSYNSQYPPIEVKLYTKAHDRFLIVDDKVYHVGASVKDLGKKLCAVSLLTCIDANEMLNKIV